MDSSTPQVTEAIGQSVSHAALSLNINAILSPTKSGYTARMISKYRPKAPIIAITSDEVVQRQLSLIWGVTAILTKPVASTDEMIQRAVEEAKKATLVANGDTIIITAGVPIEKIGTTNLMKIQIV
jgi:pyruvate kinase